MASSLTFAEVDPRGGESLQAGQRLRDVPHAAGAVGEVGAGDVRRHPFLEHRATTTTTTAAWRRAAARTVTGDLGK